MESLLIGFALVHHSENQRIYVCVVFLSFGVLHSEPFLLEENAAVHMPTRQSWPNAPLREFEM